MEIKEDKETSLVFIDGKPISGFVDAGVCPKCLWDRFYSHDYDAYFCINCDEWLEHQCSDPNCEYCAKRPPKPSMALNR
jgi:hypothetical protein